MNRRIVHLLLPVLLSTAGAVPGAVRLEGVRHEYQRLNNCGPVTIGMALSFWGSKLTQYQSAPVLKPNRADKNVSPDELAAYARSQSYAVHGGAAGDLALIRRLVAAGYPVIAQTWFVSDQGGMGHYRLITGYDERGGYLWAYDSYNGPNIRLEYTEFDSLWQVYNRTYLVVYPKSREGEVRKLLGDRVNAGWEDQHARAVALQETRTQPRNAFAWFNLGTSLLKLGDAVGAAQAYDQARGLPVNRAYDPDRPGGMLGNWPWRTLWYQFGPLEAYYKVARHGEVVSLASETLRWAPDHEESYYWRGKARAALGQRNLALADFRAALRYRPGYAEARAALRELQAKAAR